MSFTISQFEDLLDESWKLEYELEFDGKSVKSARAFAMFDKYTLSVSTPCSVNDGRLILDGTLTPESLTMSFSVQEDGIDVPNHALVSLLENFIYMDVDTLQKLYSISKMFPKAAS